MKFPGRRDKKHYFPVTEKGRQSIVEPAQLTKKIHIVGIDQLLVDIEIEVEEGFLANGTFLKVNHF